MEFLSMNALLGAVAFFGLGRLSHWLITKAVGLVPALKDADEEAKRQRANVALLRSLRGFHYIGFPVIGFIMGPQLMTRVFG